MDSLPVESVNKWEDGWMKKEERDWTCSVPQEVKRRPMSGNDKETYFSLIGLHLIKAMSLLSLEV